MTKRRSPPKVIQRRDASGDSCRRVQVDYNVVFILLLYPVSAYYDPFDPTTTMFKPSTKHNIPGPSSHSEVKLNKRSSNYGQPPARYPHRLNLYVSVPRR